MRLNPVFWLLPLAWAPAGIAWAVWGQGTGLIVAAATIILGLTTMAAAAR